MSISCEITIEQARINYPQIPESTLSSIYRYVEQAVPTGDFLRNVLSNNLTESIGLADFTNFAALKDIVEFIYNYAPAPCHGTPEQVKNWLNRRIDPKTL